MVLENIAATLLQLYRKQRLDGVVSRGYSNFKFTNTNGLLRSTVKELTKDHHPDRDDERLRVEAAGGYVLDWGGVARVNGELAISRSIGDLPYKRLGSHNFRNYLNFQNCVLSCILVSLDSIHCYFCNV